jgi:hypothetical protein
MTLDKMSSAALTTVRQVADMSREEPVGRIVAITVAYEDGGPEDPTLIGLADMREHCRAERIEDLLDDLLILCEDVQAGRQPESYGRPVLALIRGPR